MHIRTAIATAATFTLLAVTGAAQANNLLDGLKAQAGNLGMPSIGANSMGSAAGVIQYCVQNNYLAGGAEGIKDKLMEKFTGQKKQEASFADGVKGVLKGDGGKSLNLQGLSSKVKTKACDYVLKSAGSLV